MKGFKNTWIVTEEGLKKTSFTYDQHFITIGKDEEGLEELPEDYVIVPGFIDEHVHGAAGSDAMDRKSSVFIWKDLLFLRILLVLNLLNM